MHGVGNDFAALGPWVGEAFAVFHVDFLHLIHKGRLSGHLDWELYQFSSDAREKHANKIDLIEITGEGILQVSMT